LFTAKRNWSKSWGETTSALAVLGGNFKRCCLQGGNFDGGRRNHFFPALVGSGATARKGGIMSVIQWASFAWKKRESLCATCVWGTVRSGDRAKDVETFCRLINPNTVVPFPVCNCTDYSDRAVPVVETKPEERKYGFVTIALEAKKK